MIYALLYECEQETTEIKSYPTNLIICSLLKCGKVSEFVGTDNTGTNRVCVFTSV